MSQANSTASAAMPAEGDGAGQSSDRSWWRTLPGMFTAAAALISAITGLIVAVQQLRPASHPAAATTQLLSSSADTQAATASATTVAGGNEGTQGSVSAARVSFPAGSHVQIGDLRYDFLAATATAGNPGELALALHVKLTNRGRFDANFWNATFRLQVGTDIRAPTNFLDDVVHGGTTETAEIEFTLPAATTRATLLVGDDPNHAIAVPLALKAVHR